MGAFFTRLGFSPDSWMVFAQALRHVALANECISEVSSPFGTKYVVDGVLRGPNRSESRVRTVWIKEPLAGAPRLVTAYPAAQIMQVV